MRWVRCHAVSAIVLIVNLPSPADEADELADVLLAAQADRESDYPAGWLEFEIDYQRASREAPTLAPSRPARAAGSIVWNGDDALCRFRLADPSGTIGTSRRVDSLAEAANETFLLSRGQPYFYDQRVNVLRIGKVNRRRVSLALLDVRPATSWFRHFTTLRLDSFPIADFIGSKCKAHLNGDKLSIVRTADGKVRHSRLRASGFRIDHVFDLRLGGNLVEFKTDPGPNDAAPERESYDWGRATSGQLYLSRYRQEQYDPADRDQLAGYYELRVSAVDFARRHVAQEVSVQAYLDALPPNTRVVDDAEGRSYVLRPSPTLQSEQLDELAAQVRRGGLLGGPR